MQQAASDKKRFLRSAIAFVGIGLVLYGILFFAAERLVLGTGDMNPVFKIDNAEEKDFDWVILGASHAMPLDFDNFNDVMQRDTGLSIINLAGPGTGPLYNRFVLEHLLRTHKVRNVLYVADGFAFRSPVWNEDRFGDAKLLGRTPFSTPLAASLARYVAREGVSPKSLIDYISGFSKINNPDRFKPDIWEGENNFDREFRPSNLADRKRAEYLYSSADPDGKWQARYLKTFSELERLVSAHGAKLTVMKFPLPSRFYKLLAKEAEFDAALKAACSTCAASFFDFSSVLDDPRYYADTDHLNRQGVTEFFERHLKAVLMSKPPASQP